MMLVHFQAWFPITSHEDGSKNVSRNSKVYLSGSSEMLGNWNFNKAVEMICEGENPDQHTSVVFGVVLRMPASQLKQAVDFEYKFVRREDGKWVSEELRAPRVLSWCDSLQLGPDELQELRKHLKLPGPGRPLPPLLIKCTCSVGTQHVLTYRDPLFMVHSAGRSD